MKNLLTFLLLGMLTLGAYAQTHPLAQVARFDNAHIGYAASQSPNYAAFTSVLKTEQAETVFTEVLDNGTPAGRLYAAVGLYHLDEQKGRAALSQLSRDQSGLETMNGCMVFETTLGEVAAELLSDSAALQSYLPRP